MSASRKCHVPILDNRSSILVKHVLLSKLSESSPSIKHHICSVIQGPVLRTLLVPPVVMSINVAVPVVMIEEHCTWPSYQFVLPWWSPAKDPRAAELMHQLLARVVVMSLELDDTLTASSQITILGLICLSDACQTVVECLLRV